MRGSSQSKTFRENLEQVADRIDDPGKLMTGITKTILKVEEGKILPEPDGDSNMLYLLAKFGLLISSRVSKATVNILVGNNCWTESQMKDLLELIEANRLMKNCGWEKVLKQSPNNLAKFLLVSPAGKGIDTSRWRDILTTLIALSNNFATECLKNKLQCLCIALPLLINATESPDEYLQMLETLDGLLDDSNRKLFFENLKLVREDNIDNGMWDIVLGEAEIVAKPFVRRTPRKYHKKSECACCIAPRPTIISFPLAPVACDTNVSSKESENSPPKNIAEETNTVPRHATRRTARSPSKKLSCPCCQTSNS